MHISWGLKQQLHPACFISILIPFAELLLAIALKERVVLMETSRTEWTALRLYHHVTLRGQSRITLKKSSNAKHSQVSPSTHVHTHIYIDHLLYMYVYFYNMSCAVGVHCIVFSLANALIWNEQQSPCKLAVWSFLHRNSLHQRGLAASCQLHESLIFQ